MVVGYYPDHISEYTKEEQFQGHKKALNEIEEYYREHGVFSNSYQSKQKIDSERDALEKYYRKFKKMKERTKNG